MLSYDQQDGPCKLWVAKLSSWVKVYSINKKLKNIYIYNKKPESKENRHQSSKLCKVFTTIINRLALRVAKPVCTSGKYIRRQFDIAYLITGKRNRRDERSDTRLLEVPVHCYLSITCDRDLHRVLLRSEARVSTARTLPQMDSALVINYWWTVKEF